MIKRAPRDSMNLLQIGVGLLEGFAALAVTPEVRGCASAWGEEEQERGLPSSMLIAANLALAYGGIARPGAARRLSRDVLRRAEQRSPDREGGVIVQDVPAAIPIPGGRLEA